MADQFEPWPTGAGFVFSSIGVIPPAALREVSGLRSVRTEPRRLRAARAESVTGDPNH
jgi:hypothetical protein